MKTEKTIYADVQVLIDGSFHFLASDNWQVFTDTKYPTPEQIDDFEYKISCR